MLLESLPYWFRSPKDLANLLPRITEPLRLASHQAIFLKGSELSNADRGVLDYLTEQITKRTYPRATALQRQVLKFYYDVDNWNEDERQYTDWWLIIDSSGDPVAMASVYGGGIARKKEKDPNFEGSPRIFYTGDPRAILDHMEIAASIAFEKGFDYPFVVDPKQINLNAIDALFRRISQNISKPVYLYKAVESNLPFIDEIRMWIISEMFKDPQLGPLSPNLSLESVEDVSFFHDLKSFLDKNHPLNSLNPRSLAKDRGIFYVVTHTENGKRIEASAGLSYPTKKPKSRYLICATDLATEKGGEHRRHGHALRARAATLTDLFFGGDRSQPRWFQEDSLWKSAIVVSDIPVQRGDAAKKLTEKLGYEQLKISGQEYVRRWFTAGVKPKGRMHIMRD